MRLLFLSYYFPPDFSACAFRSGALAIALADYPEEAVEITVLTAQPHRYHRVFDADSLWVDAKNIHIKKVNLPAHGGSIVAQLWSYLYFIRFVIKETRNQDFDGVYATSSRLLTGFLGVWVSRRLRGPFYLDLRDLLGFCQQ